MGKKGKKISLDAQDLLRVYPVAPDATLFVQSMTDHRALFPGTQLIIKIPHDLDLSIPNTLPSTKQLPSQLAAIQEQMEKEALAAMQGTTKDGTLPTTIEEEEEEEMELEDAMPAWMKEKMEKQKKLDKEKEEQQKEAAKKEKMEEQKKENENAVTPAAPTATVSPSSETVPPPSAESVPTADTTSTSAPLSTDTTTSPAAVPFPLDPVASSSSAPPPVVSEGAQATVPANVPGEKEKKKKKKKKKTKQPSATAPASVSEGADTATSSQYMDTMAHEGEEDEGEDIGDEDDEEEEEEDSPAALEELSRTLLASGKEADETATSTVDEVRLHRELDDAAEDREVQALAKKLGVNIHPTVITPPVTSTSPTISTTPHTSSSSSLPPPLPRFSGPSLLDALTAPTLNRQSSNQTPTPHSASTPTSGSTTPIPLPSTGPTIGGSRFFSHAAAARQRSEEAAKNRAHRDLMDQEAVEDEIMQKEKYQNMINEDPDYVEKCIKEREAMLAIRMTKARLSSTAPPLNRATTSIVPTRVASNHNSNPSPPPVGFSSTDATLLPSPALSSNTSTGLLQPPLNRQDTAPLMRSGSNHLMIDESSRLLLSSIRKTNVYSQQSSSSLVKSGSILMSSSTNIGENTTSSSHTNFSSFNASLNVGRSVPPLIRSHSFLIRRTEGENPLLMVDNADSNDKKKTDNKDKKTNNKSAGGTSTVIQSGKPSRPTSGQVMGVGVKKKVSAASFLFRTQAQIESMNSRDGHEGVSFHVHAHSIFSV